MCVKCFCFLDLLHHSRLLCFVLLYQLCRLVNLSIDMAHSLCQSGCRVFVRLIDQYASDLLIYFGSCNQIAMYIEVAILFTLILNYFRFPAHTGYYALG